MAQLDELLGSCDFASGWLDGVHGRVARIELLGTQGAVSSLQAGGCGSHHKAEGGSLPTTKTLHHVTEATGVTDSWLHMASGRGGWSPKDLARHYAVQEIAQAE